MVKSLDKDYRNFYLTNSVLYHGIIKCKSSMDDIHGETKVELAKAFIRDSQAYNVEIGQIRSKNVEPILDVLEMNTHIDMSSVKIGLANIVISNNFDMISRLLRGQLYRYTARASGVNENVFYEGKE